MQSDHDMDGYVVVGIGCERGATPDEVLDLVTGALRNAGVARDRVAAVASIDSRALEPAVMMAANSLSVPLRVFPAAVLDAETPRLANPSERVFALTGCHGVAEAAALAAGGRSSVLLQGKVKSGHATAAIASLDNAHVSQSVGSGVSDIESGTSCHESPALQRQFAELVP